MSSKRLRVVKLQPYKGVVGELEFDWYELGAREPRRFIVLRNAGPDVIDQVVNADLDGQFAPGTPIIELPRGAEFEVWEDETT